MFLHGTVTFYTVHVRSRIKFWNRALHLANELLRLRRNDQLVTNTHRLEQDLHHLGILIIINDG